MAKAKPTSTKSTESSSTINVSKKSLIGLIITVVVLITLIAGAIGGAAIYFFASQTKMPSWAETYLAHIKTVRNQTPANADENTDEEDSEAFWTDSGANPKVSFYESNDNSPMMLVNYTSVETISTTIPLRFTRFKTKKSIFWTMKILASIISTTSITKNTIFIWSPKTRTRTKIHILISTIIFKTPNLKSQSMKQLALPTKAPKISAVTFSPKSRSNCQVLNTVIKWMTKN